MPSDLEFRAGIQHDVLGVVLDILHPRRQPGDGVVMLHSLPLVP